MKLAWTSLSAREVCTNLHAELRCRGNRFSSPEVGEIWLPGLVPEALSSVDCLLVSHTIYNCVVMNLHTIYLFR